MTRIKKLAEEIMDEICSAKEYAEEYLTYKSNAVCFDGITHEPKSEITSNNDMPVFDEYLVKLGVVWRFEKRSGLDYADNKF